LTRLTRVGVGSGHRFRSRATLRPRSLGARVGSPAHCSSSPSWRPAPATMSPCRRERRSCAPIACRRDRCHSGRETGVTRDEQPSAPRRRARPRSRRCAAISAHRPRDGQPPTGRTGQSGRSMARPRVPARLPPGMAGRPPRVPGEGAAPSGEAACGSEGRPCGRRRCAGNRESTPTTPGDRLRLPPLRLPRGCRRDVWLLSRRDPPRGEVGLTRMRRDDRVTLDATRCGRPVSPPGFRGRARRGGPRGGPCRCLASIGP
jgi:hypothetical protein